MKHIPKVVLQFDISEPFGQGLSHAMAKYAHEHGPWVFYRGAADAADDPADQIIRRFDWMKNTWQATGLVVTDVYLLWNKPLIAKLKKWKLPTIVLSMRTNRNMDFPVLCADDALIGKMAAQHLLDKKFQNFAYCGFAASDWSTSRCDGFVETIKLTGHTTKAFSFENLPPHISTEQSQNFMNWLKSLPLPVAIMAGNDIVARQVIETCKILRLDVPQQVAVVGVDNDDAHIAQSYPPLSSVNIGWEKAACQAAQLLDKMMAGLRCPNERIIALPSHVASRESTDTLAINDQLVIDAVRFISQHAKEPIKVNDVANAINISRHLLYDRFQKQLGRSVIDEIKRVRIAQIKTRLTATDRQITQIAYDLGFDGPKHISRYFHREMGISPSAYRKKTNKSQLSPHNYNI